MGWRSCCSVAQWCQTFCDPMDCSTPGSPVLHYLLEFAQIHVCWVGDAIYPSHPLPSTSPGEIGIYYLCDLSTRGSSVWEWWVVVSTSRDSRTLHWASHSHLWPRHPWAHWLKSHATHSQRKEFTAFPHILSLCSPGSVHIVEINGTRLCRCCLGEGASLDLAHSRLPSFMFFYLIIQWIFYCMLPRYSSNVHTSPSFTEHPLTLRCYAPPWECR